MNVGILSSTDGVSKHFRGDACQHFSFTVLPNSRLFV